MFHHRTICSVLIGVVAASGLVGCHSAGNNVSSAPPQPAEHATPKGGPPKPMDPDAKAALEGFQRALACADWQRALDRCSPQVRSAAGQYASTEAFFRAVAPVERIVLLSDFPVCSARSFPADPGREGSYYESFVRVLEGGAELNVNWTWKVVKSSPGWQMEFPTTPLDQWIQQEVARQHAREDEYRNAQIRLLPEIRNISTRLTAERRRFRLGEPILLRLELVNQSGLDLMYDDQQAGANNSLRITDAAGTEIHTSQTTQTCGGWVKLPPGETAVLFDHLDITKQYAISKPSCYSVQFRGRGLSVGVEDPDLEHRDSAIVGIPCRWPSNVVTIEVSR